MTVRALLALLDEIDHQGGPQAARDWRLSLPDHHTPEGPQPMNQPATFTRPTSMPAEPPAISVGQLLKWGDEHPDSDIRDQAARARVLLTGLRRRHASDQELTDVRSKREQLEKELADLQAREAELAPPRKGKRKPVDYPAAEVRAWAKQAGVDCPPVGRVPKAVVEAWRAAPHAQ
ncbi:hypothetical protein [Streptomyces sp. NPDC004250]|uniref:Lsr2 family DNA-binding protein n=1 Tax=Streptomyces sp. NPDC004250 TaxID=3364692 RepID=UPI003680F7EE